MDRKIPRVATQPEGDWDERDDLDRLYRRYAPWLGAMLRKRFGHRIDGDVDDVVQETYARLAPQKPEDIKRPQALLMKVASNLTLNLMRNRAVRGRQNQEAQAGPPSEPGVLPLDLLLAKEAILAIPAPYRDVFVLSRFHGMSYEEIATRSGLSVKTVEWRLSKAAAYGRAYMTAKREEHR
jgi:RNA polymerase sigma-70 factor (ECF subfamily)